MQAFLYKFVSAAAMLAVAATTVTAAEQSSYRSSEHKGAVFVMTNDASRNEVIVYERTSTGQLSETERVATEGRGSGGTIDPLQSQGSLVLSQHHEFLFAANAGSGTISVFHIECGHLQLTDRVSSGGSEPLSIAQNGDLVYVLNGAAAGAVVAFRWNNGHLHEIPNSTMYLSGTSAGGSSITIDPQRNFVVVTERLTNSIDTFHINADGKLTPIVVNHSSAPGVFAAAFTPNGELIVSETGPAGGNNASALSAYRVLPNGSLSAVSQSVPTLGAANCWNAIAPNGKWVYVSNAGSSDISGFTFTAAGTLAPIGSTVVGVNPSGSTNLDLTVSTDSKFLYSLDAGSGMVSIFAIQQDGSLVNYGQVDGFAKSAGVNGIAAL